MAGKLMTMPVLIVNMGGEMVYILEQRLQAQKIPPSKGEKVLNDVVRTMYYPRFIEELFKPQEMYSIQSTRQIFDRLAHSSIMRLNESSMDKLFDLMAMGFKYQIVSCNVARELVDITQNHLDALKRQCVNNQQLLELLDECIRQMELAYGGMTLAEFNSMRHYLCSFFQDRKVKVSLFLHDQTQNQDGSIVVPSSGVLPVGHLQPGTVRYFQGGVETNREAHPVISASSWALGSGMRTSLGTNLYEKDRSSAPPGPPAAPSGAAEAPPPCPPPPPSAKDASAATAAVVGELNMLASLIGAPPVAQDDHFKLENLFSSNVFAREDTARKTEVIEIDGGARPEYHQGLEAVRGEFEDLSAPLDAGQDDLLDLMDKA